eukprot:3803840-Amphidinium_carterae.1
MQASNAHFSTRVTPVPNQSVFLSHEHKKFLKSNLPAHAGPRHFQVHSCSCCAKVAWRLNWGGN